MNWDDVNMYDAALATVRSLRRQLDECREELAEMSTAKADLVGQVDALLARLTECQDKLAQGDKR